MTDKLIIVKGHGRSRRGGDRRSPQAIGNRLQAAAARWYPVMPNPNEYDVITVKEAADFLRVHRSTIYRLLKAKRLPGAFRVGSDWRVRRSTLVSALKELADSNKK